MSITTWLGGETGLEALDSSKTSLWYTKVVGEIPRVIAPAFAYNIDGYHEVGMVHETAINFKAGSVEVYIDGTAVTVSEVPPNVFQISNDRNGMILVKYLPESQFFYIGKGTPDTHYSYALCPLLKTHLTNLIAAINDAQGDLHLEKTLWTTDRLGRLSETAEITSLSVVDNALFVEIKNAINHLRFVLQNTYSKFPTGSDLTTPGDVIDSEFIISARIHVNNIETKIAEI